MTCKRSKHITKLAELCHPFRELIPKDVHKIYMIAEKQMSRIHGENHEEFNRKGYSLRILMEQITSRIEDYKFKIERYPFV